MWLGTSSKSSTSPRINSCRLLLTSRAPTHVNGEYVGENGLIDAQTYNAGEDRKKRDPAEVFSQGEVEELFFQAVMHDCESEIAECGENGDDGEEDLEAVDIVVIQMAVEPADDATIH
jgi:hypothetical protein